MDAVGAAYQGFQIGAARGSGSHADSVRSLNSLAHRYYDHDGEFASGKSEIGSIIARIEQMRLSGNG